MSKLCQESAEIRPKRATMSQDCVLNMDKRIDYLALFLGAIGDDGLGLHFRESSRLMRAPHVTSFGALGRSQQALTQSILTRQPPTFCRFALCRITLCRRRAIGLG